MIFNCIAVGLGGFLGSVSRYLIGNMPVRETTLFPVKTFGINVAGCIVIALIITLVARGIHISPRAELFLKVGFCGGFTTFSTFAVETVELMRGGHWPVAFAYVILSVMAGIAVVMAILAVMAR